MNCDLHAKRTMLKIDIVKIICRKKQITTSYALLHQAAFVAGKVGMR